MKYLTMMISLFTTIFFSACQLITPPCSKGTLGADYVDSNYKLHLLITNIAGTKTRVIPLLKYDWIWGFDFSPRNKMTVSLGSDDNFKELFNIELTTGNLRRFYALPNLDLYSPIWSPDGKKIVFQGTVGDNYSHTYVMNPDGSDLLDITGTDNNVHEYAYDWSADGKYLLTSINNPTIESPYINHLSIVRPDGSDRRIIYTSGKWISNAKWSPDGHFIVGVVGVPLNLFLLDWKHSTLMGLTGVSPESYSPTWLPDSQCFAYIKDGSIYLYSLETKKITLVPVPMNQYTGLVSSRK